ncbi:tail fiber protein [Klebsiella phage KpKT21phi1]|uniref:Tail fiber protein n=1 Tax=Klebsiella phage KpKT21phi1 TaxID=2500828 RepID=A0A3T0IH94_9CAUD|nr:tail fiber protein [Klebsiella phage KpKT21phi1]AZU98780.1 tail fiber protein [Klebsiella phage KpKT21phi1]
MALYREGKAAMAADGTVTGTGTKWQSSLSLIRPGATIMFLSSPIQMAVVNKVVSDTEIKAITTKGAVVASSDYAILLSDSLTVDGLAQDVAETLRYYQSQETVIADAVEFFKTFDFESLQNLANQVKADSQSAGASATAAAASERAAKTSETNAKASENKAKTSETNAKASETAAKTSETNAKASETAAKTSETNAKSSENKAKTSETNAKASETAAKTSETNAKASENKAKTSETNAKASETAAKTSETNAKASETAANSAKNDAQTAKGQTQSLYNQTVDLVAGVQAPDKIAATYAEEKWMKIANIKSAGDGYAFVQFIIGGGTGYGTANLPVDIFSLSGRGLPVSPLTSDNIDIWFTQRTLISARPNDTRRINLGVVKNTDFSFDVYLHAPGGWIPELWLNRLNVQANNGSITGPIIDRTGYSWITTEPDGIVYNSPSDYLMANDNTIPRTNVANTFSQPQAISVPGGNATLTLNGCVIRANNSNAIVYSTPENGQGMYFRPNGDTNSAKQVVFDASNFSVTGLNANFSNAVTMSSTLRVNGAASLLGGVNVNGSINSNGVVSKNGDIKTDNGNIELYNASPLIDFHFNRSNADFTARIINDAVDQLTFDCRSVRAMNDFTARGLIRACHNDAFVAWPIEDPNGGNGAILKAPSFISRFNVNGNAARCAMWLEEHRGYEHRAVIEVSKWGDSGTTQYWQFKSDGKISSTANGEVVFAGLSDINYKDNVVAYDGLQSLENIKAMNLVKFTYKDDAKKRERRGVIAQQVRNIDSCYVKESNASYQDDEGNVVENKKLVLDNNALLLDAICAIKALSAQVDELKEEIKNLKG